jgi:hypothetical protein
MVLGRCSVEILPKGRTGPQPVGHVVAAVPQGRL